MKKLLKKTFLRFILVGIVNTIFGTTVMFVSYNLFHLGYWLSSALNYILGSVLSYFLNKYFTFKYKEKSLKVVVKFAMNIGVCYIISYGLAKPLVLRVLANAAETVRDNVAMVVGMGLFVILNYCGQRFFTFSFDKAEEKNECNDD